MRYLDAVDGDVYKTQGCKTDIPVIVIPAADWERLAELAKDAECDCGDHNDPPCFFCEVRSFIARTEASNG